MLDGYDWSKGTLRFPIDQSLPRQLTARLVEVKLVHLRSSSCTNHAHRGQHALR
jgi:uncharacterized protein YdhG (YjbR/CyaY superfamily)